jgi:uncharacterized protein (TIGR03382 family)
MSGGQFGLTYASSGFSVTTGQKVQYLLAYNVDDPPIIHGFVLSLDADPPVFPGSATITSDECLGANFSGGTCPDSTATETVFSNGLTSSLNAQESFSPPISLMGEQTTITLDATAGGSAEFQSVSESAVSSPEPAATLPLALALLVFLLGRRKLQFAFKMS